MIPSVLGVQPAEILVGMYAIAFTLLAEANLVYRGVSKLVALTYCKINTYTISATHLDT